MSLGWAILGPGAHAGTKVAPAINTVADGNLVAVVSRDRERRTVSIEPITV